MEPQNNFSGTAYDLLKWLRALQTAGIDLNSMYVENDEGTLAEFEITDVSDEESGKTYTAMVTQ